MSGGSWPSDAWRPPGAPPPGGPPPAGASLSPGSTYAPPGGAYPPWSGATGPPRTNPLAVVALVAGCAQLVFWFVGAIVAVVTGHVALRQIRRSGGAEGGTGLARAGLVLGYAGLALSVLAVVGIVVFVFAFLDDVERAELRDQARAFVADAERAARLEGSTELRDPEVLTSAYFAHLADDDDHGSLYVAGGIAVDNATRADWERAGWRVELFVESVDDVYVCAIVPSRAGDPVVLTNGPCRR